MSSQPFADLSASESDHRSRFLTNWVANLRALVRTNWIILIVLIVFLGTAFWVPVLTPVATTDDWGYSRSVEILLQERELTVFPVVAATSVFQIVWGTLFAAFTDNTLGAVRAIDPRHLRIRWTGTLRALRTSRGPPRSECARHCCLAIQPTLVRSLLFLYDRSPFRRNGDHRNLSPMSAVSRIVTRSIDRWVIAGSLAASAAILIRQQGVLIPLSVGLFFLLTTPDRSIRALFRDLLTVGGIPFFALLGYVGWLNWFNGVPDVQQSFASEITEAGVGGAARLLGSLTYFELLYLGFFLLPITIALIAQIGKGFRSLHGWGWLHLHWVDDRGLRRGRLFR